MKNTRLVYNDEKNLKIYQTLSPEDFKEFFMTYLTYKPGTELEITDFSNPLLYALFLSFKDKIDYNEAKWEKQAAAKRENGKKGGRPKKTLQDTVGTEFDITPVTNNIPSNEEIKNTADLSPSNDEEVEQPQPTRDNTAESLKMGNNEIIEDNTCMERKPLIKIAASKQSSNMERLQNIINTDDDFYKVYNNCIKAVVEYKLSNGDIIKANSKDMAMQKLKNLCHSYQIPYNEETHNFILKDVNYSISNMGSYSVA
jgi:hypothetical protein